MLLWKHMNFWRSCEAEALIEKTALEAGWVLAALL
jgi:hypothetical protein